jgi:carboxyl-terminal processing protease
VRLTDFNETTACTPRDGADCERELEKAFRKLKEQGATSFVLDIRDNPGGLLDQAFAVSNMFLKKGQLVVYTRGRNKRDESNYITEEESPFVAVPLVVLTSRHSASASEIVAGALQDHDRALTVGETTFGKGLVQTIIPLRNVRGYALALTTGRYYTPSGRSIQAQGIEPDIVVEQARIEKVDQPRGRREADLRGALRNEQLQQQQQGQQPVAPNTPPPAEGEEASNVVPTDAAADYQLARAFDLLRGLALYNARVTN